MNTNYFYEEPQVFEILPPVRKKRHRSSSHSIDTLSLKKPLSKPPAPLPPDYDKLPAPLPIDVEAQGAIKPPAPPPPKERSPSAHVRVVTFDVEISPSEEDPPPIPARESHEGVSNSSNPVANSDDHVANGNSLSVEVEVSDVTTDCEESQSTVSTDVTISDGASTISDSEPTSTKTAEEGDNPDGNSSGVLQFSQGFTYTEAEETVSESSC